MNTLRKWLSNWRKQFKFAVFDPKNFNEVFGFTTSKIRLVSLFVLTIFFVSGLFVAVLMWTPLGKSLITAQSAPEQTQIIDQRVRMDSLTNRVEAQEKYIRDLKRLFFGDFDTDTVSINTSEVVIDPNTINPNPSNAETQIGENVKADQYTNHPKETTAIVHFLSPVKGKVSQKFKSGDHEALDIVTPPNSYFSACLAGTVVFSDYSPKDGNILIIEHPNNFLSIYKHAKTVLKKRGDKVRAGDLIGVVGNSGANSTGPHLHFELWLNQQAVDPQKYMVFE